MSEGKKPDPPVMEWLMIVLILAMIVWTMFAGTTILGMPIFKR